MCAISDFPTENSLGGLAKLGRSVLASCHCRHFSGFGCREPRLACDFATSRNSFKKPVQRIVVSSSPIFQLSGDPDAANVVRQDRYGEPLKLARTHIKDGNEQITGDRRVPRQGEDDREISWQGF
jgi:hypothetical protein